MDWKIIVKPIAKFALKFGLNFGLDLAAKRVAKKPEKGEHICADVSSLGELVKNDAEAIKDGNYDDVEKAASDAKVEALVDRIFAY